jgi:DNA-binding MarR family transcriptional regulator
VIEEKETTIKEIQNRVGQPPSIVTRGLKTLEEKGVVNIIEQTVKLNKLI